MFFRVMLLIRAITDSHLNEFAFTCADSSDFSD